MIRSDKRLRLCKLLLVCILIFIWGNSLLPGNVSGALSDWVKTVLEDILPAGPENQTSGGLLRKFAHFTEFTALGMTLGWLFGMLRKKPYWPALLGVAAACMDETIQRFVPGRGPSVRDVLIDSSGVLTGLILLYLGHTYCKYRRNRSPKQDR